MEYIAKKDIGNIKYYQGLYDTLVFIDDLKHKGLQLINEAKALNITILGAKGASPKHNNWIRAIAVGENPKLIKITFPNNVSIVDYNCFDTKQENVPLEEMQMIVDLLKEYGDQGYKFTTGNTFISNMLGSFEKILSTLSTIESDNYSFLRRALKGGANWISNPNIVEPYEIHYDYHQLYAYVITHNKFPCGEPTMVEGYVEKKFAIYQLGGVAKLKKNGYPIIPSYYDTAPGADGKEFRIEDACPFLCSVDLDLFMENYDVKELFVLNTMYYSFSFDGNIYFKGLVDHIYSKRLEYKGKPQERFYKVLNEILPGHFEMSEYFGDFYKKDFKNGKKDTVKRLNPIVGIFITAYGRKMLYELLKRCNKKDVIGFDTDCVFLRKDYHFDDITGDNPGQIHEDGRYINVVHYASKRYVGFDYYTGEYFQKISGKSKTGKAWRYNKEKNEYELVEVAYETRQFTF